MRYLFCAMQISIQSNGHGQMDHVHILLCQLNKIERRVGPCDLHHQHRVIMYNNYVSDDTVSFKGVAKHH